MQTLNIHEAKTQLSRLVEEALAGEKIIIAKAGKPLVVLTPYSEPVQQRKGGQLAGQIVESPDCWDTDELAESIGAPLYPTAESTPCTRIVAEGSGDA